MASFQKIYELKRGRRITFISSLLPKYFSSLNILHRVFIINPIYRKSSVELGHIPSGLITLIGLFISQERSELWVQSKGVFLLSGHNYRAEANKDDHNNVEYGPECRP